jgi:hypothetical protein|tara:strand:+ start:23 stop:661 length:639 start_codon:yes stop_codon:yes gene_type:complete
MGEVKMKLLTTNTKIDKSMELLVDYYATILQLLPNKHFCVNYKLCIKDCLAFKGLAKIYPSIIKSRKAKSEYFINDNENFIKQVIKEIKLQIKRANKKAKKAIVRLNGFTDIDFSKYGIFKLFPNVQFYDYSADYKRVLNNKYENLHYTFSYKGNNLDECLHLLSKGINIAVIDIPKNQFFNSYDVNHINGDTHDFRFLDKSNSIVWLSEKK